MTDRVDFHEYQDMLHDYDHLEPEEDGVDDVEEYGEFLEEQYTGLGADMKKFLRLNDKVGRGPQGAKWRVKYKRSLARRDQVDQVFSELRDRGFLEGTLGQQESEQGV